MDRLAAPAIDEQEGSPISRNKASDSENKVSNANVVQSLVDIERGVLRGRTGIEFNGS